MKKIDFLKIIRYAMIDLHLHFEGAISADIIQELIKLQPDKKISQWDSLSEKEKKELLSVRENCNSLDEYLKLFDYPCSLLQTPEAVKIAMKMLAENLEKQGYIYVDIRFAPQLLSSELRNKFDRKMTTEEGKKLLYHEFKVVEAALKGIKEAQLTNMEANIILCCMRNKNWNESDFENNNNANKRTIKIANMFDNYYKEHSFNNFPKIVKLDIAGGEEGNPNKDYLDLYSMYKNSNFSKIKLTIHSGEAGKLEDKLDNLSSVILKTNANIGHGVALGSIYNKDISSELKKRISRLISTLAQSDRVLEMCLSSNYQTKAICDVHPIVNLIIGDELNNIPNLRKNITINTDNPVVSNTSLEKEFELFIKICMDMGLSEKQTALELLSLKKNSITQSNMSERKKNEFLSEIQDERSKIEQERFR